MTGPNDDHGRGARVLILAPTARDAEVTRALLSSAGLGCLVCAGVEALAREAAAGAGAVLTTEEALLGGRVGAFLEVLAAQPAWSELPVVLLMRGAGQSPAASDVVRSLVNVTLLERPAATRSVVSAVQAALRDRAKQYALRDQIARLRAADAEKQALLSREQVARADAEHASRMKEEFLATLSHELRTPLNAILGWAELLRHTHADPATLTEGLDVIERNARVQTQLIEDLLDMSRIVAGKVRLDMQRVSPAAVIEAAAESVRPSADAKGVHLGLRLDRLAGPVTGDPARLQQVVWNLLANAIKFTPRGGRVEVRLARVSSHVEITVADTGAGIAPDFLPHVFERFRQADASTTRQHGGLGVGLSIVKQLAEMHGGSVRAESPGPGGGATFTVELPVRAMEEAGNDAREDRDDAGGESGRAPRHPQTTPSSDGRASACNGVELDGVRVLVVDDEPDARVLIKRFLERCGAKVVTAASAAEALQVLGPFDPHVIVSDIGMPLQDGYEFMTQARRQGVTTPALALTAFARAEDRLRSLYAGYQLHLSKPVEPAELVAAVAGMAGRPGTNG